MEAYLGELDGMAHEARASPARRPGGARPRRCAATCSTRWAFAATCSDYYDPRNSYLNEVLDRRTGIPITLSAVAMAVGGRAGLEVVGVGLPGHFVAKAWRAARKCCSTPSTAAGC